MTRLTLPLLAASTLAAALNCDLSNYKEQPGLKAENTSDALRLSWQGERREELRAAFGIDGGTPVVRELAARKQGGQWAVLGRDLKPEFQVTSGIRRITQQQLEPLRALKVEITPEVIEREKWNAFWDAPLSVPGSARTNPDLPRKPEEIRRAMATYSATGCKVKTDGARLEV